METVQFQIFMFSITLYGGFLIGVLYDIYRAIRGTGRKKGLITSIWDILFLIISFFIVINVVFSSNFGDLRAYIFIGFIVGFFLYEKIAGRIFQVLLLKIFTIINVSVKKSIRFVSAPFKLLWGIITKPFTIILVYIKKITVKFKNVAEIPKKALKEWGKYYKLLVKRDKS